MADEWCSRKKVADEWPMNGRWVAEGWFVVFLSECVLRVLVFVWLSLLSVCVYLSVCVTDIARKEPTFHFQLGARDRRYNTGGVG